MEAGQVDLPDRTEAGRQVRRPLPQQAGRVAEETDRLVEPAPGVHAFRVALERGGEDDQEGGSLLAWPGGTGGPCDVDRGPQVVDRAVAFVTVEEQGGQATRQNGPCRLWWIAGQRLAGRAERLR